MIKLVKTGATRWCFLTKTLAIKIPALWTWKSFIQGILGNIAEGDLWLWATTTKNWSGVDKDLLCPVIWSAPLSLILIMPRCEIRSVIPECVKEELARNGFVDLHCENIGVLGGRWCIFDYA